MHTFTKLLCAAAICLLGTASTVKAQTATTRRVAFTPAEPHYSTSLNRRFTADSASKNANNIDISYFFSSSISFGNLVSPLARNDQSIYGSFAIDWGRVSTEFRLAAPTDTAFGSVTVEDSLSRLFERGTQTRVPNCPDGTRITQISGELSVGQIILFKSQNKYGMLKVITLASSSSDSLVVDFRVWDRVTAVDEPLEPQAARFMVYPNSSQGLFYLRTQSVLAPQTIRILSLATGQEVTAIALPALGSGVGQAESHLIDLQHLSAGVYMLLIGNEAHKVIITK